MKKEIDISFLDQQKTFRRYESKRDVFYDDFFEHQLIVENSYLIFSHHCEVNGDTIFISFIESLEELQDDYKRVTGKELEIKM